MASPEQHTTTVSTKGQVVLPSSVRQSLHWPPGTKLVVEHTSDGVFLRAAPVIEKTSVSEVFGMLKYSGAPKTLEEMDDAILDAVSRDFEGD